MPDAATLKAPRERIVSASERLLFEGGRTALSTRAICDAAGVQAPTIYRLFGDKDGLLDALTLRKYADHLQLHSRLDHVDSIAALRAGWEVHVSFGLTHPYLYSLMYGQPRPGVAVRSAAMADQALADHVRRIAEAGRLAVAEPWATDLLRASLCGITLTLISLPEERRDPALSAAARDATISSITTEVSAISTPGPVSAAVTLRALLPQTSALNSAERGLMINWLDRIADQ